jgi:hypothetical protein
MSGCRGHGGRLLNFSTETPTPNHI